MHHLLGEQGNAPATKHTHHVTPCEVLSLPPPRTRCPIWQVMGVLDSEELQYLLEPRLADEVVMDYLDRKVIIMPSLAAIYKHIYTVIYIYIYIHI